MVCLAGIGCSETEVSLAVVRGQGQGQHKLVPPSGT